MTKPFSIAIHGGAGTILRDKITSEMRAEYKQVLTGSVKAGHKILASDGDALDAVVEAVKVMEDSPLFNAGKGSVLTNSEMVAMDASIMHGATSEAGAIAGVRHIKNPVELARDVMNKSNHVFLIGEGTEAFAFEQGYEFTEQDYFFTERRYEQLQSMKKGLFALSESKYPDDKKYGTVGAVALDSSGN
jgi:beta-aspartyl-peptidase (threonine type)